MLRKTFYPKIEPWINRGATYLHSLEITPNQLTLAGTALCFFNAWVMASGCLFLGGIFLLVASAADLLDGPLARLTQQTSKFGAFLDSTMDRYSDFFIFAGLATCLAKDGEFGKFLLTMGALAGAFVTSYSKARAENFIANCGVGPVGRAERIVLLAIGLLIRPLLPLVLWLLMLSTNGTAIYRILHTRKALSSEK